MTGTGEGRLIIISGPSGCGKTTIVNSLLARCPEFERSVSYTTRPPREGEKDGEDYIFISEKEFSDKERRGEFLEQEENFGERYATGRDQVERTLTKGRDIILCIDVKGAQKVMELYPGCLSIFIVPPSKEVLRERLTQRATDQEEQLALRLEEAAREMAVADAYDHKVVNEDLEVAVNNIEKIIKGGREGTC